MATYSSVTGCTVILLAATCGSAIADSGNQDGVTVGIMGENAPATVARISSTGQ